MRRLLLPTTVRPLAAVPRLMVAHFGGGDFAAELKILRYCADHGTGEKGVALADARAAEQRHGVHQAVVVAQLYVGIDVAKGANLAVFADFGFGMDKGQRRNHGRCGCEGIKNEGVWSGRGGQTCCWPRDRDEWQ